MPSLLFSSIVDVQEWQKIQDLFADVIGISIRTVSPTGELLTKRSRECVMCERLVSGLIQTVTVCNTCATQCIDTALERQSEYTLCNASIPQYILPITTEDGRLITFVIIGPLLVGTRGKREQYVAAANNVGLDIDEFMDCLRELKVVSFQAMDSIAGLIREVFTSLVRFACEAKRTVLKGSDEMTSLPVAGETLAVLKENLEAMFDVSMGLSNADSGGLFFMSEGDDTFSVFCSRGYEPAQRLMKQQIIKAPLLSYVIQNERPIMLSTRGKDLPDEVAAHMNQPQTVSSLLIPLACGSRKGVMTINAYCANSFFRENVLKHMHELCSLATEGCLKA